MFTMEMAAVRSSKTNQSTPCHNPEDTGSGVLGCVVRWVLLDVSQEHSSGVLGCVVRWVLLDVSQEHGSGVLGCVLCC
jgi:hypothetical protein